MSLDVEKRKKIAAYCVLSRIMNTVTNDMKHTRGVNNDKTAEVPMEKKILTDLSSQLGN